jgi:transcriptional regulator with XRE-family HTH domain
MKLGDRLRELRKQRNMKLHDVASSTELSLSYLSDLERNRTKPSLETLGKLAKCYGITIADIMNNIDTQQKSDASLAPGLSDLVQFGEIDEQTAHDLNCIELHGKRPQRAGEWRLILTVLKFILGGNEK